MSIIATGVGSPGTVSAGGGRIYSFNNISTTPAQVIGANPQRQKITVHNPGTIDIFMAPVNVQNGGSDAPLTPSTVALGGCLRLFANGGSLVIDGGVAQGAWQAFSASSSNNPLTVMDTNS